MLCNWTRWTTYLRQEIFLLIEDKSKVQVPTWYIEERSCGRYSCVYNHTQAGYLWRREYSMNYFTYPCSSNSNIAIAPFCLKMNIFTFCFFETVLFSPWFEDTVSSSSVWSNWIGSTELLMSACSLIILPGQDLPLSTRFTWSNSVRSFVCQNLPFTVLALKGA